MYLPGKKYKYISYLLIGAIFVSTIAGALFGAPVVVYAWSVGGLKGTIASLIISLMLQTGAAPTNTNFLNSINNAYGVESSIGTIENMIDTGLLSESGGQLIDTGLSQAIQSESAWTEWGLNEIFETTIADEGVIANTGAVNLANQAINLGTAGTIGAFAGAVAVGVGVGILANHVQQKYINPIRLGLYMDTINPAFDLSNYSSYMRCAYTSSYSGYPIRWVDTAGLEGVFFAHGNTEGYVYNRTGDSISGFKKGYNQGNANWTNINQIVSNNMITTIGYDHFGGGQYKFSGGAGFSTNQEALNYLNGLKNGTEQPKPVFSPDLIGENGNLKADIDDQGNYDIPDIRNIVPDGQDMTPVDMDDYQDYVDQANDNTENNDTGEDTQGQDFQNFVTPYFVPIPDEPIIPDNPVGPEQPEMPVRPTPAPEEIQDVLNLTPTADLKDKFPFCIPFDIYDLISGLQADREAPVITCPVDNNGNTVTVDLSEYDSVAELLRLLELILFIIGLAIATRYLIGATGGG